MPLFRSFFHRKPLDHLLEVSERAYVFDCCYSKDVLEEEYGIYLDGIVEQLQSHFPDDSFLVFNFKEGERRSRFSDVLAQYDMTVMDYPRQYEGCPLLSLEMIHHFLRSSESWLSLEGQQNVLLMHCERGGWPVLAFMLAGLLLYQNKYNEEQKTLEMIYNLAPKEFLQLLSPLNSQASQLRYLKYISRRNLGSDWPPSDTPLVLDCLILRVLPLFDEGKGCRPVIRVYGQDPSAPDNRSSKLLFSTSNNKKHIRNYLQADCMLMKMDIHCRIQGDVVLECIHFDEDLVREEIIFRVMFHTAFVRSNILMLNRDEIDVLWDARDQFPKDFKAVALFLDADLPSLTTAIADDGDDDANYIEAASPDEFFEVEEIFSSLIDGQEVKGTYDPPAFQDCASDDENTKHDRNSTINPSKTMPSPPSSFSWQNNEMLLPYPSVQPPLEPKYSSLFTPSSPSAPLASTHKGLLPPPPPPPPPLPPSSIYGARVPSRPSNCIHVGPHPPPPMKGASPSPCLMCGAPPPPRSMHGASPQSPPAPLMHGQPPPPPPPVPMRGAPPPPPPFLRRKSSITWSRWGLSIRGAPPPPPSPPFSGGPIHPPHPM